MFWRFCLEVICVGLVTAVIGFIITSASMFISQRDFTWKKYNFWWQVALSLFITGALVHILCQLTGINHWYCDNGVACKK